MLSKNAPACFVAWLTLAALLLPHASAHSTPTAPTKAKEEEAIVLTPIEVVSANDQGWLAGSTMLGNRTNQPLKDTPITIDALTKEFLTDVGAFTPEQAANWIANVAVAPDVFRADLGNFNFRGMTNQFSANRNFFRWYGPQDNYNIERLDFGRGSNTLIFGDNDPGGQVTVYTKRALPYRRFVALRAVYGSWGSRRGEFDYNQPIGEKLAVRLNVVNRTDYRNFDWNKFNFKGTDVAVTYQPFKNTIIRFEGDKSGNYRTWDDNNLRIRERSFTGLGFTTRLTVLPNGKVVDNGNAADSTPNNTPLGDGTTYQTATDRSNPTGGVGQSLTFLNRSVYTPLLGNAPYKGFPENYAFGGPNTTNDRWYDTWTATIEHNFTDKLSMDFAFNQFNQWNRVIEFGPVNTANADSVGRLFTDVTYSPQYARNRMEQFRGSLSYNFDRWSWMQQFIVLRAEYRDDRNINYSQQLRTFGPNFGATGNTQPVFRVYMTDPYPQSAITEGRVARTMPPNTRLFTNVASGQNYLARGYSVSSSGKYFGGRLMTLLGARLDDQFAWGKNRSILGVTRDPVTLEEFNYGDRFQSPSTWAPLDYFFVKGHWSYNGSIVYVLKPNINAYYTYSTSYRWGGGPNIVTDPTGPLLGSTHEIGLKSSFFKDRLVWTFAAYDLIRKNVSTNIDRSAVPSTPGTGPTGLTGVDLSISNAINWGLAPTDPAFKTVRTGNSPDVTSQRSRGIETTVTYYPTSGLSARFAGSYKDVTYVDAFPVLKKLLFDAQARGPITDPLVQQTIAALTNSAYVQGAKGRKVNGQFPAVVAPVSFNSILNYRFDRDSRLKGWNVGISGSYSSDAVLRYLAAYPDDRKIKGGWTYAVNANAGYRTRIYNLPTSFNLNVNNIAATKYPVISSVALADGSNHNLQIYGQPLSFQLSVSTEF